MNSEQINRAIFHLEEGCGHYNAILEAGTMSRCFNSACPHVAWVCYDCESSTCCNQPWNFPDYINNAEYVLNAITKHGLTACGVKHDGKTYMVLYDDFNEATGVSHITDSNFNCAVLLAVLKKQGIKVA